MSKVNIAGYTVSANPTAPNSLFGQEGGGGQGVTFVPKLTETENGYMLSWTNDGGLPNPEPVEITNGTDGTPGTNGEDGTTFTPEVTSVQGGYRLSWTNDGGKQNPDAVEIMNGTNGAPGTDGENGATFIPEVTAVQGGHKLSWTNDKGLPNPPDVTILDGEGGEGGNVPAGGTVGQFLKKASADDYDTEWGTVHEIPAGGNLDQVLAKASGTDFDLKWVTPSGGGGGGGGITLEEVTDPNQANFAVLTLTEELTGTNYTAIDPYYTVGFFRIQYGTTAQSTTFSGTRGSTTMKVPAGIYYSDLYKTGMDPIFRIGNFQHVRNSIANRRLLPEGVWGITYGSSQLEILYALSGQYFTDFNSNSIKYYKVIL